MILYEFLVFSGAADYQGRFIDKYFFAKTKGNKYTYIYLQIQKKTFFKKY